MKTVNSLLLTLLVGLAGIAITGCNKTETPAVAGESVKYTCPMHPEVVQDKAGSCPKCSMALVKKT
jgi:Cu(I)/Ag(I) efflux system membrane fusion protein